MRDVVPGGACIFLADGIFPLLPGQERRGRSVAEPCAHALGEAPEGEGCWGDDVEALAEGDAAVRHGAEKCLGYIISVHVVDGLHPEIRQGHRFSLCQV